MDRRTRDGKGGAAITVVGMLALLIFSMLLLFTAGRSSATATEHVFLESASHVGENPFVPSPTSEAVDAFAAECGSGVRTWRDGFVSYPEILTVDLNESAVYAVAVDVRSAAPPERRLISGSTVGSMPIAVQCVIAARLMPIDRTVEVDKEDWIYREFTPSGVVNWAWSVKASKPTSPQLRLALQPAVAITVNSEYQLSSFTSEPNTTTTFTTDVDVQASWVQHLNHWWTENWQTIGLIVAGIGVAMTAFVKWGGDFGLAIREAAAKWRGTAQKDRSVADQPDSATEELQPRV